LVLDLKIAEDLSILEQQQEFLNRYRDRKEGQKHPGNWILIIIRIKKVWEALSYVISLSIYLSSLNLPVK